MAAGASASPPPVEVAGPTSDGVTSAEAEAASRPALPWPKVAGEADALAPADEMDGASIQSSHDKSELPFSKARCIALVATLTGAAFLNVSLGGQGETGLGGLSASDVGRIPPESNRQLTWLSSLDPLPADCRHHTAHHWRGPRHPRESAAVDRIVVRARLWLLPAALGPHRRHLRQAFHLHRRLLLGHSRQCRQPLPAQRGRL
jgi:hypothetical protein